MKTGTQKSGWSICNSDLVKTFENNENKNNF